MTDIRAIYYTQMIYYIHGISTQYTEANYVDIYIYIIYIIYMSCQWMAESDLQPGFRKRHLGLDLRRVPGSRSCAPSPTGGESTGTGGVGMLGVDR